MWHYLHLMNFKPTILSALYFYYGWISPAWQRYTRAFLSFYILASKMKVDWGDEEIDLSELKKKSALAD